jgi:hypothetical protein
MKSGALTLDAMDALTAPQWQRASQHHLATVDGQWEIWRVYTDPVTYTLWRKRGKCMDHAGTFPSADAAKEAARG